MGLSRFLTVNKGANKMKKYTFKELKSGAVSVYKGDNICCIIDTYFRLLQNNETPLQWCERVFKNE